MWTNHVDRMRTMKLLPDLSSVEREEPMDEIGTGPDATPLEVLLAIQNNPALPLHTRHRAARDAAPFVHAKRSTSTSTNINIGLATALEAAHRNRIHAPQTQALLVAEREREG
jgi:hypothetical protein